MADLIQAEYFRKYGAVVPDYYMGTALTAHRLRARFDGLRADRVWRRAGFDGHTLWVDLGGRPRRLYGISAEKHGPAVPYSPDAHVVMERHGNMMPEPETGWRGVAGGVLRPAARGRNGSAPSSARTSATCSACTTRPRRCCSSGPPGSGKTAAVRLARELADPVGIEHAAAVLPKPAENLRKILAGSPVVSFDNVRRLSRKAADTLAGALEGLAMTVGALEGLAMTAGGQKHPMSFGNVRLVMAASEGKPARLHSLAGKIVRYELPPVEEWKTMGKCGSRILLHEAAPVPRDVRRPAPRLRGLSNHPAHHQDGRL